MPRIATSELIALHKRSLMDMAAMFTEADDADFLRHLQIAAREISKCKRTRTLVATLALSAGVAEYAAPADMVRVKASPWGVTEQNRDPWGAPREPLPRLDQVDAPEGGYLIRLNPAPTAAQLRAFGAEMPIYYLAHHAVPASGTGTITEREVDLLLLRAKVEALREASIRNANKPVTLRAGQGMGDAVMSKNTTPPALYEQFLREYNEAD